MGRLPATVGIDSRVIGIHISLDDLVGAPWVTLIPEIAGIRLIHRSYDTGSIALTTGNTLACGSSGVTPVGLNAEVGSIHATVLRHIVVIHILMNSVVAVQVAIVDVVVDDCLVYLNIGVIIVDVDVADVDVWP